MKKELFIEIQICGLDRLIKTLKAIKSGSCENKTTGKKGELQLFQITKNPSRIKPIGKIEYSIKREARKE